MGTTVPTPAQTVPISLHLQVDNADAMFKDAIDEMQNRYAKLFDVAP